jgi:hypothetical protein
MIEDKVMRNETLAHIFKNRPDLYPYELEKQFSRIVDQIAELWGKPQLIEYFDKLMLDDRGNRKGFPREVMSDLWLLEKVHAALYPELSGRTLSTWDRVWRWANGAPIDPRSLDKQI